VYWATAAAGSFVGSIGSASSNKLAFILPNIWAIPEQKNATALALNAAKHGAETIQALATLDPNARDILIVTDIETFRIELRKRLGDESASH
jgi:hypothetical protein